MYKYNCNAIRVAMQSHADSMIKHARDCIARRIELQLCLYTTGMTTNFKVLGSQILLLEGIAYFIEIYVNTSFSHAALKLGDPMKV